MPKKEIHPNYHPVTIKAYNKDGSELSFQSFSTIKNTEILAAEFNIYNHPAWKNDAKINTDESVNKIMQKFTQKFNYKVKA